MPFQKTFRILLEEDNTDGSILDSVSKASGFRGCFPQPGSSFFSSGVE